jgi:hypothetical protein
MNVRLTGLARLMSFLMVLGCATDPSESASEDRMWRAQLERQQRVAREAGRIGWIGNADHLVGEGEIAKDAPL